MLDQPHSSRLDANGEVGMPFHAPRPGRYVFSTEGSDFDTVLTLLDNRGNTLASDDDGGAGVTSRIEQVLAPGEYRIVASGFGGGSGQLQLSVTNAAGSSNDADPVPVELIDRSLPAAPARASHDGSTRSRAIQMSGDHRESGSLQGGAELWFSVQVQTPAIWEFSTGGSDFDTVLALYDPADEQVARDDDGGGGTSSLLRHSLTPGLWRVQLSGFSQSSGSYQLAGEAFSGLGIEALTLGQPHAAELSAGQELEFELNVTNEAEYSISTEGSDFDTVLSLHDVLGAQLASDDDGGNGTTSLITQQLEAGSYLVRVRGFSSAAAGSLILVASAEPVRLQPRRLRAAQGIEPDPAPSDGAGTGSGAADYDAVQLENAQLNLRVVELEVESQTRAAAAELQAARFVVEESRRALASFVEHEAPLEVARQELAIDRARAGVELASAELESIQAKMAESDNDLAELNAHLRARQQDVEFARRELELAETSMDVLAEIGIARRQRKLEQGVAEASAELEAAERALEVAELLGQLAINEARQ